MHSGIGYFQTNNQKQFKPSSKPRYCRVVLSIYLALNMGLVSRYVTETWDWSQFFYPNPQAKRWVGVCAEGGRGSARSLTVGLARLGMDTWTIGGGDLSCWVVGTVRFSGVVIWSWICWMKFNHLTQMSMCDAIHMKGCRKKKESGKRGLLVQQNCLSGGRRSVDVSLHHVLRSRCCCPRRFYPILQNDSVSPNSCSFLPSRHLTS